MSGSGSFELTRILQGENPFQRSRYESILIPIDENDEAISYDNTKDSQEGKTVLAATWLVLTLVAIIMLIFSFQPGVVTPEGVLKYLVLKYSVCMFVCLYLCINISLAISLLDPYTAPFLTLRSTLIHHVRHYIIASIPICLG